MKYEFAVAYAYHMSGGKVEDIDSRRFADYDSAEEYAHSFDDCHPTIYIIIDDKYVFYCHRSMVSNSISWVYSIEAKTPWGQVETRIWWKALEENPSAFYHLAEGIIGD